MNTKLKEGQKAPHFSLLDASLQLFSLADFQGKWVVLYFYPKDNTPGCTTEALAFTRLESEFQKANAVVLGVSKDSCASHQKFIDQQKLTVALLSDSESVVQKQYGVWCPKKFMGREFLGTVRSTFLIDPNGVIRKIWDEVNAKGHAEEVLSTLKLLTTE
ncbi:MAG: alkyl hydroperoxide reductase/Thiol specific antioxidant/Mal allergen, peroxiredoxin Q/BCP [Candidatus Peregrinibacteria bacterium GW2011_GWE2_39_6]|nr:MAG: alkyl hydroperoxide reductase/Thiol specific antioxidant/Mal allergen, peroxiredoxin Q/BCP [Candidatus Peregrinibacteria bacterium GW2011_GWF2_39_17]KKR25694.1 MAG: alkyl hydroperoxide reductase/Thiol specific antioxidant/Mal allergen, peroxiredoxin Q/BCP [Candidatus Peregrinibacteria bacterium GW2011_GWE2_39_6]HCW32605.1 thioredoxin-dependent thiol peroxidase [Candidatus Peregrinibacteria bacterium]